MQLQDIKHIAVIGAGLMGHGIAQIFANKGYSVSLLDVKSEILERAVQNIRNNLTLLAQKGIGIIEDIEPTIERMRVTQHLEEALSDAQFVIEAVYEDLDLKQTLFREMDGICSQDTILTTNTSAIRIAEIAQKARGKERIVGTHFWNPPYLIPLVEIIRGKDTSNKTIGVTFELLKQVGKHPVLVNKDVPGFVGNRLQHALWREAISIVERGIADSATVDEVVKEGFGMRLAVLGPLENADMVGLDLTLHIHNYILKHIESSTEPSDLLKKKVEEGKLGFKKGEGFYDHWRLEDMDHTRKNLLKHLIDLKIIELQKT